MADIADTVDMDGETGVLRIVHFHGIIMGDYVKMAAQRQEMVAGVVNIQVQAPMIVGLHLIATGVEAEDGFSFSKKDIIYPFLKIFTLQLFI